MENMFCKNCGDPVVGGEKFCDKCGKEIVSQDESSITSTENIPQRKTGVLGVRKFYKQLLLLAVVIGVVFFSFSIFNSRVKTGDQIFSGVSPAVVRIGVRFGGTVIVPEIDLDRKTKKIITTDKTVREQTTTIWLGTGFIVDPRGYIVTNAHVVDLSTDTVDSYIFKEFATKFAYKYWEGLKEAAPNVNENIIADLVAQILDIYGKYAQVNDLTYQIAVFDPNQKQGTFDEFIDKGFHVVRDSGIKKMGEPYPNFGKDLAIIKIDRPENLPTVKLGDSNKVRTGDRVYVLGYPTIADLNNSGDSVTKPTLTSGIVSAIKKSETGNYNVIQIDAAIAGGNSGGPAMNERGEVIGVATFGATESQGYNWILPVSLAKEFLDELNVKY
ncbi:MAG: trypsin-like peptidase domain-containing protein [Patescibacteria group bacterium]